MTTLTQPGGVITIKYYYRFEPTKMKITAVIDTFARIVTPSDWWIPKRFVPNHVTQDSPYRGGYLPSTKLEELMQQHNFRICTAFNVNPYPDWDYDGGGVWVDFETHEDLVAFKLTMV